MLDWLGHLAFVVVGGRFSAVDVVWNYDGPECQNKHCVHLKLAIAES